MSFEIATSGMQSLHETLTGLSFAEEVTKSMSEFIERMQRLRKKLGDRCEEVSQFAPLSSTLRSIGNCCREAITWLKATTNPDAFELQCKCRSIIARHFDLFEGTLELFLKKKCSPSDIIHHILAKTNQPDEIERSIKWWAEHFGDQTVVSFEEVFEAYCTTHFNDTDPAQRKLWRKPLFDTMCYTQGDHVTVHEYAYFILCWYPSAHLSPKSMSILLRQGCFQPLADRKNYNLLLKAPGDYFIRNTVNQGGGWCISYLDSYMKAKHVLLAMKTDDGKRGWEFPSVAPDKMSATSVVGMILRNTDKLLIPRGKSYGDLPHLDWENYTHAAGDEEG